MQSLIVDIKNKADFQLISQLLEKLGLKSRVLTKEEREDIALVKAMDDDEGSYMTVNESRAHYKTLKKAK